MLALGPCHRSCDAMPPRLTILNSKDGPWFNVLQGFNARKTNPSSARSNPVSANFTDLRNSDGDVRVQCQQLRDRRTELTHVDGAHKACSSTSKLPAAPMRRPVCPTTRPPLRRADASTVLRSRSARWPNASHVHGTMSLAVTTLQPAVPPL